MIKLKELIKENVQLPNGVEIQMGKIFTGGGRAFAKEEDSESVKEAKIFSDDWNLTKRVTSNFIKQNLKSVDNSIKKKDGEGLRFHLNQIIKGIQNAKRALKLESVNEGGMGILSSDQADILQGIVLRNKNKNLKGILNVALKSGHFKNVDKKELLGYIDGAKQFVKYMKSHPMENRS